MRRLHFYNSITREVEPFETKDTGKARIYNCGPTVYKRQHIGNMRRFLFSDFLRRTLETFGFEVREITNITDVGHLTDDDLDSGQDKLEEAAKESKLTPKDIADKQTELFFQDLKTLNIRKASLYPRATQYIKQMQDLIELLIKNEHAYVTETGVYYDVRSFKDYGKLSGNKLEDIEAGKRVEVREEKRNAADFALWVIDDTHLQVWDSPWGKGYPGWHIECSAMSLDTLGNDIDIHTGGEDNRFPHHENEIAQSEGATGKKFVRFWMHNHHLQMGGVKLAKSGGAQVTLDTLIEQGYSPLAFRLLVFASHYRSKMDFSDSSMDAASENLKSITSLIRRLLEITEDKKDGNINKEVFEEFSDALADDLNTPEAYAVFLNYVSAANILLEGGEKSESKHIWATLMAMDNVVGVISRIVDDLQSSDIPDEVLRLANDREAARQENDFELADKLREAIEKSGYLVEDTDSGPRLMTKDK